MNYFWKESGKSLGKMVKLHRLFISGILLTLLFICSSFEEDTSYREYANSNSLINLNKGMQAFGFRTQEQWRNMSKELIQPYFPVKFTPGLFENHKYIIYPYWQGDRYEDYFFDHIERVGYLGYMLDPNTGLPALTYSWTVKNVVDYAKETGIDVAVDLVLYCSGKSETDVFLCSDSARATCIRHIMNYAFNRDSYNPELKHNANGINVFFPDFSFEKKREFGLFIKDLCWAYWDSINERKLDDKELIVTFPLRDTIHRDYLDGLFQYIDQVYYADFDYRGMMKDTSATMDYWRKYVEGENNLSILQKMVSEMRIADLYNPLSGNVKFGENWVPYLLAIILILFLIIVTTLTSLFWGRFNQFITENKSIVFLVGALLITEVAFLYIFMVEKMNYDIWLINTDNPSAHYFLLIPALLILLFPIIRLVKQQKKLP